MKIFKYLRGAIGAASAVFILASITTAASASTVPSCATNSGLTCLVNKNEFGSGNSGNDKEASVEAALAAALGLTSIDLTLLGKSDGGYGTAVSGKSGTWSVPGIVSYLTVKAANSYLIFDAGNAMTGSWTTMGILNNGGNQPNVSHISYWSGSVEVVPLPAGGFLLLTALGALALRRKR